MEQKQSSQAQAGLNNDESDCSATEMKLISLEVNQLKFGEVIPFRVNHFKERLILEV